jgi:hypothetical protein
MRRVEVWRRTCGRWQAAYLGVGDWTVQRSRASARSTNQLHRSNKRQPHLPFDWQHGSSRPGQSGHVDARHAAGVPPEPPAPEPPRPAACPADPPPPPLAAAPLRPAFTEAELPAALAPAAPRPALDAPDIPATAAPAPPPAAAGPGAPATVLPLPPLAAGAPASAGAGDPAGPPRPAVGSITPAQFEQPADGWPADGPPWPATMGTAINRCGAPAGNPSEQAPSARAASAAYRGVPRGRNRPA